jgi:hypothetical protein
MHLGLLQQPPAQLSRKDRSANQKTTFFDSIDPKQTFAFPDPVWFLPVDGKAKDSCPERPR